MKWEEIKNIGCRKYFHSGNQYLSCKFSKLLLVAWVALECHCTVCKCELDIDHSSRCFTINSLSQIRHAWVRNITTSHHAPPPFHKPSRGIPSISTLSDWLACGELDTWRGVKVMTRVANCWLCVYFLGNHKSAQQPITSVRIFLSYMPSRHFWTLFSIFPMCIHAGRDGKSLNNGLWCGPWPLEANKTTIILRYSSRTEYTCWKSEWTRASTKTLRNTGKHFLSSPLLFLQSSYISRNYY